jgi:hypothetical protein
MSAQVLPEFHPEGHNQIKNNRRPKSQKGGIDKIEPNTASRYIELLSQPGTYPKYLILYVITDPVHSNGVIV